MTKQRRSPRYNVDAPTFLAWLDKHHTYGVDLDQVRRSYINGVWVDPTAKRELRRYRNGHVLTLRPETAEQLANRFNLTLEEFHGSTTQDQGDGSRHPGARGPS